MEHVGYIVILKTRTSSFFKIRTKGESIKWPLEDEIINFQRGGEYFEQIITKNFGKTNERTISDFFYER